MNPNSDPVFQDYSSPAHETPRQSFWQRLGGGSLTIAVIFHAILLLIGAIWVFQVIHEPETKVDFMPPGGGGGERGADHKIQQKKQAQITPPTNVKRVFAEGANATYSIPEQGDNFGEMSTLSSLTGGGMSGGLGGSGTGAGFGKGEGLGGGLGTGGGKFSPFGIMSAENTTALVGTFYDLKQTRTGKPTDLTNQQVQEEIVKFTTRGWRESSFNNFYKAKQTLSQTKLYIPMMNADGAPSAFNCADEVQPSRWVVVYRGVVTPPRTGRYRFVGAGDDILVARFDNKTVFDHGYFSGTTMTYIASSRDAMLNKDTDKELEKRLRRDYPMERPMKTYQYGTTGNYNSALGGLAVGPWFEARSGQDYPIEMLLNELPGGKFCAVLLIEEEGVEYQKAPTGAPILPLFRLDGSEPEKTKADNAPPYDPNGPVWQVRGGRGKAEI